MKAKEYLRVPCRLTESFAAWTGKVSGRGILILSTTGRLAVSHAKILVPSPIQKIGRGDRTEKIFLVPSPRVRGTLVGSSMLNFGSGDRTKVPSGPGDRTEKIFLVPSPHQKIRHGDRTKNLPGSQNSSSSSLQAQYFSLPRSNCDSENG